METKHNRSVLPRTVSQGTIQVESFPEFPPYPLSYNVNLFTEGFSCLKATRMLSDCQAEQSLFSFENSNWRSKPFLSLETVFRRANSGERELSKTLLRWDQFKEILLVWQVAQSAGNEGVMAIFILHSGFCVTVLRNMVQSTIFETELGLKLAMLPGSYKTGWNGMPVLQEPTHSSWRRL